MAEVGEINTKLSGATADIPIVHSFYQLYASLDTYIKQFPKSERYTLGATLQNQLLQAFEQILIAAANTDANVKSRHLKQVSAKVDLLRLLIRLAKDCKCLSNQAYIELESGLHEIGRMLGGWIKSLKI